MRRTLLIALLLIAPISGALSASAGAKTSLAASLGVCRVAKDAGGGQAKFVGSMPAIAHAARLEMHFGLQRATDVASGYKAVAVPAWTAWVRSPKPGKAGYIYTKQILGLSGPAIYRAVITFRWRNAAGKVIRKATRTTPGCKQPDVRPNLKVLGVGATARNATTATYHVLVGNTGRSAAFAVAVRLGISGMDAVTVTRATVAHTSRVRVKIVARRCVPGTTVDLAVDPDNTVAESDETDNAITVACPLKQ